MSIVALSAALGEVDGVEEAEVVDAVDATGSVCAEVVEAGVPVCEEMDACVKERPFVVVSPLMMLLEKFTLSLVADSGVFRGALVPPLAVWSCEGKVGDGMDAVMSGTTSEVIPPLLPNSPSSALPIQSNIPVGSPL